MNTETNSTQTDNNNNNDAAGEQDENQNQAQDQGDSSQDKGGGNSDSQQQASDDQGDSSQGKDEQSKDDKKTENKKDQKDDQQKQTFDEKEKLGAPEEYSELAVPEGYEMGDEQKARVNDIAKKFNLNNFQRNGMLDFHTTVLNELKESAAQEREAAINRLKEETATDPELNGQQFGVTPAEIDSVLKTGLDKISPPARYQEDMEVDGKAVKKGDPVLDKNGNAISELELLANQTGLIHAPAFRRFVYRSGKLIRPDTVIPGSTMPAPGNSKDPAEVLFPNQGK